LTAAIRQVTLKEEVKGENSFSSGPPHRQMLKKSKYCPDEGGGKTVSILNKAIRKNEKDP